MDLKNPPQVIKDLVRKMPSTIVYDIKGVAPMVGPLMFPNHARIPTKPLHFNEYPWEDPIV